MSRTQKQHHRVFVSSFGALTPNGLTAEDSWEALKSGRSGIAELVGLDLSDLTVTIGGQVSDFDPNKYLTRPEQKRFASSSMLGIAAADEAMSKLQSVNEAHPIEPSRFSILAANGYGPTDLIHESTRALDSGGPRRVSPYTAIYGGTDAVSTFLSVKYGAMGTTHAVSAACASGTVGLGEALRSVRHGYTDVVMMVATEDSLNRQDIAATANIRALASDRNDRPETASRPFDRARSGFVMSAGAACLILESEHSIRRRGLIPLAEVLGYGCSSDAYHITAPHPEGSGAAASMRTALEDAGLVPTDVDYINAHGTGTPYNDATELAAIAKVLEHHATKIPISSTKSMTGHMIGAAGAAEAIFSIQAIRDGIVPPTINLDDPEFPEYDLVPHHARSANLQTVMSNSFGFGGHNATIVLREASAL